jgi:hypothetical protein
MKYFKFSSQKSATDQFHSEKVHEYSVNDERTHDLMVEGKPCNH